MKASLGFRDDDRPPLLRGKLPFSLFTIPCTTSFSTSSNPSDLCFNVSTSLPSYPSLRLTYTPNSTSSPLSLSIRTGSGHNGSPFNSPFFISTSLDLASSGKGGISFSIRFKPRLGDFVVSKQFGLSSNMDKKGDVSMSSVVPVRSGGAMVRFRWGLKIPVDLQADANAGEEVKAVVLMRRLPYLVIKKVSVERVWGKKASGGAEEEVEEVPMAVMSRAVKVKGVTGVNSPSELDGRKGTKQEVEEELRRALMSSGK